MKMMASMKEQVVSLLCLDGTVPDLGVRKKSAEEVFRELDVGKKGSICKEELRRVLMRMVSAVLHAGSMSPMTSRNLHQGQVTVLRGNPRQVGAMREVLD